MLPDLQELQQLVSQAAREELLPRFAEVSRHVKPDGSLVTGADLAMQRHLQKLLKDHWPDFAFLGEEMTDKDHSDILESAGPGLWCLDPLDGTSNFAAGIPFFAVSLALLMDGEPVIGVIFDPVREECFSSHRGKGAWLNGERLNSAAPRPALSRCIAAVDFKRLPPALAARLGSAPPYGSQRNFGASALEWCWLAADRFHLYLHGGQKLWDYAAGSLILAEAGGIAQSFAGQPVCILDMAPHSIVAARDRELFGAWNAWVQEHLQ